MTDSARAEPGGRDVDATTFRRVLGHYPTGVCVVAAFGRDGQGAGFTVGSFTSVSLDPPLVAFCPDKRSRSWSRIRAADVFAVNILAQDQEALCRRFSAAGEDRLASTPHRRSPAGAPILQGVLAWVECTLHAEHDAGDHSIAVARVTNLNVERNTQPLTFAKGQYGSVQSLGEAEPQY